VLNFVKFCNVHAEFWRGNVKGNKEHLEDLVVDGRIIVKFILQRWKGHR